MVYNALLGRRHRLLVRTLVVLLRPTANAPNLTGVLEQQFAGEPSYLTFRYRVFRLWEMPVEWFLSGGLGLVPLAPLGDVVVTDLPAVIARMDQRIRQEGTPEEIGTLWTAADVLMGLRYDRALVAQLMRGVHNMKESVTYQAIVEEGRIAELHETILELGRDRLGEPEAAAEMALRGITDLERLRGLRKRLLQAASWQDLLAKP